MQSNNGSMPSKIPLPAPASTTAPDDTPIGLPPPTPAPTTKTKTNQDKLDEFNTSSKVKQPRTRSSDVQGATDNQNKEPLVPGAENALSDPVSKAFGHINVSTGLALAFVILVVLIWMLIPTKSGYTRLQLLWFTFIGNTKLSTDTQPNSAVVQANPPQTIPVSLSTPVQEVSQPQNTVNLSGIDFSALDYGQQF